MASVASLPRLGMTQAPCSNERTVNDVLTIAPNKTGHYPETVFWETMRSTDDVLETDFWPGTTFVLPVTHAEPAIAAAPLVNARRLPVTYPHVPIWITSG
jgi:hypothetical protein